MSKHKKEPFLPKREYVQRITKYSLFSSAITLFSLTIGILDYHIFEGSNRTDSLVNTSMMLGGKGPVNGLHTNAGKIFPSVNALFPGMIFLVAAGVLFAPHPPSISA